MVGATAIAAAWLSPVRSLIAGAIATDCPPLHSSADTDPSRSMPAGTSAAIRASLTHEREWQLAFAKHSLAGDGTGGTITVSFEKIMTVDAATQVLTAAGISPKTFVMGYPGERTYWTYQHKAKSGDRLLSAAEVAKDHSAAIRGVEAQAKNFVGTQTRASAIAAGKVGERDATRMLAEVTTVGPRVIAAVGTGNQAAARRLASLNALPVAYVRGGCNAAAPVTRTEAIEAFASAGSQVAADTAPFVISEPQSKAVTSEPDSSYEVVDG